jgi:hypothetical protein
VASKAEVTSQVLRTLEADVKRAAGLLQQARGKWAKASASKFPLQSRNSQPGVNGVIQPLLFLGYLPGVKVCRFMEDLEVTDFIEISCRWKSNEAE